MRLASYLELIIVSVFIFIRIIFTKVVLPTIIKDLNNLQICNLLANLNITTMFGIFCSFYNRQSVIFTVTQNTKLSWLLFAIHYILTMFMFRQFFSSVAYADILICVVLSKVIVRALINLTPLFEEYLELAGLFSIVIGIISIVPTYYYRSKSVKS